MDSVIGRVNAGVETVVAIKDYLLERQNKYTYFLKQLYSTHRNIRNTGNS